MGCAGRLRRRGLRLCCHRRGHGCTGAPVASDRGEEPLTRVATRELTLAELLDDPLVGLVMKRDGVDRQTVELRFQWWRTSAERRETNPVGGAQPPAANALSE
jgi:hypothetical protein